jgi:hypothetical protein
MSSHFLTILVLPLRALPMQNMNIHKANGIGGTIVYFLKQGGSNLQDENLNN